MTEPVTATGALAGAATKLKDWPLWLFVAVALTLTVFGSVPEFRELAPPPYPHVVLFGAVAAYFFAGCRAVSPATQAYRA
jgi:hypothetical protein